MKRFLYTIPVLFVIVNAMAQSPHTTITKPCTQKYLNVYVVSKGAKFEFLPFTVTARAYAKSIFSKKRMRVIIANKSEIAAAKIDHLMKKHHALIANLWFDSHGLYKNGFSSFSIGQDNFNYKNINDSLHTTFLKKVAAYTDNSTKVGIGSCYAGATFVHPGSAAVKSGPMYGDSLMTGMGNIFSDATIYASGGWVMMKPGIFADKFGFAGYPLGKRYRTAYWRPVWDHLGEWYAYSAKDDCMKNINTVALSKIGEIKVRERNYLSLAKAVRKQGRAIASLQP